jgi:hypothetical protein
MEGGLFQLIEFKIHGDALSEQILQNRLGTSKANIIIA